MGASGVLIPHQPHHGGCSFILSHSSTTTTSPSLPQFNPNRTQPPGREPLPSVEGCGLKKCVSAPSEARTPHIRPSPFQRDVGARRWIRPRRPRPSPRQPTRNEGEGQSNDQPTTPPANQDSDKTTRGK